MGGFGLSNGGERWLGMSRPWRDACRRAQRSGDLSAPNLVMSQLRMSLDECNWCVPLPARVTPRLVSLCCSTDSAGAELLSTLLLQQCNLLRIGMRCRCRCVRRYPFRTPNPLAYACETDSSSAASWNRKSDIFGRVRSISVSEL